MATQNRPEGADDARDLPTRPDEPGPRDVPDEQVIEKTLPETSKEERDHD